MAADDRPRIKPVDEVRLLRAAACDFRLSRGDVGVFAVILTHCDVERRSFPGPSRISKAARLAVANVKISLRVLERLHYIEIERPGLRKKNKFTVLESPPVAPRSVHATSLEFSTGIACRPSRKGLGRPSRGKTGIARNNRTGLAGIRELGMPVRHEVASKAPLKSQEMSEEKREALRAEYLATRESHPQHARLMERTWPWLKEAA